MRSGRSLAHSYNLLFEIPPYASAAGMRLNRGRTRCRAGLCSSDIFQWLLGAHDFTGPEIVRDRLGYPSVVQWVYARACSCTLLDDKSRNLKPCQPTEIIEEVVPFWDDSLKGSYYGI